MSTYFIRAHLSAMFAVKMMDIRHKAAARLAHQDRYPLSVSADAGYSRTRTVFTSISTLFQSLSALPSIRTLSVDEYVCPI